MYKPFKMKAAGYANSPMKKNFPDLSGDGVVTQKDVLMGKGVIPTPNKKRGCKSAYKKYDENSAMKMYKNKRNKSNKPCAGCKSICPSCRGKK